MADEWKEGDTVTTPDGQDLTLTGGRWVPAGGGAPLEVRAPENKTLSEMKGLTKAGGSGLIKGAADVVGMPGDVQSLATAGLNAFMPEPPSGGQQQAVPSGTYGNVIDALKKTGSMLELPTSQGVQKGIEKVTGPLYQPQTSAEKIVSAGGEAVPFGMVGGGPMVSKMLPNMARAALGGAASEAAGQATEGTPYETAARVGAGVGAYGLSGALQPARVTNPVNATQAAAQRLEASGVRVPASAISGSRLQATLEGSPLDVAGAADRVGEQQAGIVRPPNDTRQYSQVLDQRRGDLQAQGNQLGAQTAIPATPQLRQQLATDVGNHLRTVGGVNVANDTAVQEGLNTYDQLVMGQPALDGSHYQALRQEWNSSGNPTLRTMANHLDAAMDTAHPGVWNGWRQNWADYEGRKAAADAMGGAASVQPLSPDKVVSAMHRRTPMRNTYEDTQTVQAAQPKPYDFTTALTGLGGLAGLGAGAAYHGGMMGASDLGIYGLLSAPSLAAMASGGAGALFKSRGGQNFLRNLDPKVVSALLAKEGVVPKGAPTQEPQGTPQ